MGRVRIPLKPLRPKGRARLQAPIISAATAGDTVVPSLGQPAPAQRAITSAFNHSGPTANRDVQLDLLYRYRVTMGRTYYYVVCGAQFGRGKRELGASQRDPSLLLLLPSARGSM